ncbi:MAG: Rab family GTPase [Promethearchaeota archaeon]
MSIISKLVNIWNRIISKKKKKIIFKPPFGYDHTFKIMLLGQPDVGKKALTDRFCYDIFNPSERLTIGVDFHVKEIYLHGKRIKLQIWEFAGEERFRFLLPSYCLGANAALIIFDITNSQSLEDLVQWIKILREQAGDVPIMLVGSKLDLEEFRELNRAEGINIAKKYNLSSYSEISTKTGENVEKTFEALTEMLLNLFN